MWPSARVHVRDLLHAHVCMASFMLMRVKKVTLTPLNGDPYNEAHARQYGTGCPNQLEPVGFFHFGLIPEEKMLVS